MSETQEAKIIINTYGVHTSRLIQGMRKHKIGDELTDAELEAIAGVPCGVGCRGYGFLQSAIKALEREGRRVAARA